MHCHIARNRRCMIFGTIVIHSVLIPSRRAILTDASRKSNAALRWIAGAPLVGSNCLISMLDPVA